MASDRRGQGRFWTTAPLPVNIIILKSEFQLTDGFSNLKMYLRGSLPDRITKMPSPERLKWVRGWGRERTASSGPGCRNPGGGNKISRNLCFKVN